MHFLNCYDIFDDDWDMNSNCLSKGYLGASEKILFERYRDSEWESFIKIGYPPLILAYNQVPILSVDFSVFVNV